MTTTQATFITVGEKAVFCCLSVPETPSPNIVIMSHGFRGTNVGPARTFVNFERQLTRQGYTVLRFDQPNSGNSEGEFVDSSFREWVETTAYFARHYLDSGHRVVLLGQSMGATASVLASARPGLRGRIACLLLWVPDPKATFGGNADEVYVEGGQCYRGRFWQEAEAEDFFAALEAFAGPIHLVYGEQDRYVSPELRRQVIEVVQRKGQQALVLPEQDHSPWDPALCEEVYRSEISLLARALP
ncbi:MAG TPA: alpha/beta fold hydrolase [Thermomicrobiaceae bacterium]|nr:alpha/beta fold hydrolase [Thermomicrobiaceae bacterium]